MQHLLLQALKLQYTAELASIQQQQATAQQALRQRFRRLTGDRALGSSNASLGSSGTDLGASGKSTYTTQGTAQPGPAAPAAVDSTPAQSSSTQDSATYTAQPAAPYNSSTQGVAANSAQSLLPHTSHTGAALSNQPLSASWGEAASLQTTAPDHANASLLDHGIDSQQQPDSAQDHFSSASMPQQSDLSRFTGTPSATEGTTQLNSTMYSQQEPVAQSASQTGSTSAYGGDHLGTEATDLKPTSPDTVAGDSEQGEDINKVQALDSETPGGVESDQSMSRSLFDSSKPPRPASRLAGQQGIARSGAVGQQPTGMGLLHDRSGVLSSFPSEPATQ